MRHQWREILRPFDSHHSVQGRTGGFTHPTAFLPCIVLIPKAFPPMIFRCIFPHWNERPPFLTRHSARSFSFAAVPGQPQSAPCGEINERWFSAMSRWKVKFCIINPPNTHVDAQKVSNQIPWCLFWTILNKAQTQLPRANPPKSAMGMFFCFPKMGSDWGKKKRK